MKILLFLIFTVILFGCTNVENENFVFVKGGISKNRKSNLYAAGITIQDFYISKYEVTQKEWKEVMGSNPSKFIGDSLPVEMVTWYDCIDYCIRRSLKEGVKPYYNMDRNRIDENNLCEYDSLKWTVTINHGANGYRLPSEAEWEYAAGGGQNSKSYNYCGGIDIDKVAWYWHNSGDTLLSGNWSWPTLVNNNNKTKPVGCKLPNELGIYDMSGNVREWCEDWYVDSETKAGSTRTQRGGGWMGSEYRCEVSIRDSFEPTGKGPDQGFRVCRGK